MTARRWAAPRRPGSAAGGLAVLLAASTALVAGCTAARATRPAGPALSAPAVDATVTPGPSAPATAPSAEQPTPIAGGPLLGSWSDDPRNGPAVLTFTAGCYVAKLACGLLTGAWVSGAPGRQSTPLVLDVSSLNGSCVRDGMVADTGQYARAAGYRFQQGKLVLTDIDGHDTVYFFRTTARPTSAPDHPFGLSGVRPTGAPLPRGLTAPVAGQLLGRWVAQSPRPRPFLRGHAPASPPPTDPRRPSVTFSVSDLGGTDGCNDQGADWSLGPDGELLTTGGVSTAVGCDGESLLFQVTAASRLGLDGTVLVVLDRNGHETTRLVRP